MNTYKFDESISIVNLGDIHRGNKNCNTKLLKKNVDYILSNDDVYWVSTGDLLEVALKSSKSSCYDSSSLDDEADDLTLELSPISHKCLGFVRSNHHNRLYKDSGLSLDRVLADRIKIPYLGASAIIKVTCGRCAYFIVMHHGTGGGSSGNKVNRALVLAQNWLAADVYLTGHTHSFSYVQDIATVVDRKRDKMSKIVTHHVTTGHYLEYEDSYAEDMGLHAKPCGSSIVTLAFNESGQQTNKKVTVDFLD